jgi:hypothetical protein
MKSLTAFLLLFSLTNVFADCVQEFRELHNKKEVKLVKERTIEIVSKRQLKYLIEPELKVIGDYMTLTDFSFDGDNGLSVTTEQYLDRNTDAGMGYRISITDGGEFSEVRYYLRIRENRSIISYPVLYRVQKGPVRVSEYICER